MCVWVCVHVTNLYNSLRQTVCQDKSTLPGANTWYTFRVETRRYIPYVGGVSQDSISGVYGKTSSRCMDWVLVLNWWYETNTYMLRIIRKSIDKPMRHRDRKGHGSHIYIYHAITANVLSWSLGDSVSSFILWGLV